jgi:hypothetical protein
MPGHGLADLVLALLHAVAAPTPPLWSPWRTVPPPSNPCPCTTTATVVFGCATPPRVRESPVPFPERPAYRPMEPSDPDASPWGRRVGLCAIHGWACPNRVAPAQGPSSSSIQGEKEGREEEADERRITVVTGPVGGVGGSSNGTHHHWSRGLTLGTNGTLNKTINVAFTDLADPCRTTTTTSTSIHRSRPVGLRYAAESIESVRQPGTPTVHPLRHPI